MKKIFFLFVLFALAFGVAGAQWKQVSSGISEHLTKVFFPSKETGYAIGFYGLVLKTTDGGTNWNPLSLPVSQDSIYLRDVFFLNDQVGWISGSVLPTYQDKLFKTTNGGASWSLITPDSASMIQSIHFFDEQHGFVCGYQPGGAIIWKTENGGTDWSQTSIGAPEAVYYSFTHIAVPDDQTIYLSGWDGTFNYKAVIVSSSDGGKTWKQTLFEQNSQTADIQFFDAKFGYAVTTQSFLHTHNGGTTWETTATMSFFSDGMHFLSPDTGFVFSGKDILKTENGGQTFSTVFTLPAADGANFVSLYFVGRIGYALGSDGSLVKYSEESTDVPVITERASRSVLFPQPLHRGEDCTFVPGAWAQEGTLTVINMLGQTLASRHFTPDEKQIPMHAGDLFPSAGTYLLRVLTGSREESLIITVY